MNIIATNIPDVLIIEPRIFADHRGFFFESYNEKLFQEKTGIKAYFVQDNHSRSSQNVLRGLHYQIQKSQAKLVRAISGAIYDVAVDIRQDSRTFGQWTGCLLSADNKRQLWIPVGFAHGFLVLSEFAEVVYKATNYYAPEYERTIIWNDAEIGIDWHLTREPTLSVKDQAGKSLKTADLFQHTELLI
ncbi:MAG: dTDP-4-dehydrorhamnose 3,5-epimerase [Nostochopsis sp.]